VSTVKFCQVGEDYELLQNYLRVSDVVDQFPPAQPSWADPVNLTSTPDYTEVTQAIDNLLKVKASPGKSSLSPEAIAQQLGELKLQKYILEAAKDYAQCRNETGKTLAVYAHKGKKSLTHSTLYYLANGQTTDDDWNCDGVYCLPELALQV
jgi:hypothetical protein